MKQGNSTVFVLIAAAALAAIGYFAVRRDNQVEQLNTQNVSEATSSVSENQTDGILIGGALMTPDKNIVDNIIEAPELSTAVAAIQAADLIETLKAEGPYTVFIPTNEAFDRLPEGTMDELVKENNQDRLESILNLHVAEGSYSADESTDGQQITTLNGESLTINKRDGRWWINDTVQIATTNVASNNGVIHVIDAVLMPSE